MICVLRSISLVIFVKPKYALVQQLEEFVWLDVLWKHAYHLILFLDGFRPFASCHLN